MQRRFHVQELVALALHHPGYRNARRTRHDFGDFLGADLGAQQRVLLGFIGVTRAVGLLELGLERRQLAVLQLRHPLPIALAARLFHRELDLVDLFLDVRAGFDLRLLGLPHFVEVRVLLFEARDLVFDRCKTLFGRLVLLLLYRFALDLELNQSPVEPVHRFGLGVDFHLDARGRFVDKIDRLVRQEAVGDVPMRQLRRGDDRRVGNLHPVMDLVALLQAAQDGNGGFHRGLVDQHLLETTLERGILLDILAIFVEGGGAHAMQLAAGECGLQHVAGIDRPFGLAGADHRVHLVDKDDRAALVGGDVLEHRFEALLEFAAILGTREQRRHVERQHALVLERFRDFAVDDALGEPFNDGGLAHARLADQHRIVLGAPLQDLDGAANLVVAADDRIELAFASALGQIDGVFLERLALSFGFLAVDGRASAHGIDGRLERLARQALLLQQAAGFTFVVGKCQQKELAGDELVTPLDPFLVGQVEEIVEIARHANFAALAFNF